MLYIQFIMQSFIYFFIFVNIIIKLIIYMVLNKTIRRLIVSISFNNKSNNQYSQFLSCLNEGVELKRKGKYLECLESYKQSEKIARSCLISRDDLYSLYKSLGKIYYILGNYKASAQHYMKGFNVFNITKNDLIYSPHNYANELMHLGYALVTLEQGKINSKNLYLYRCSIDPYFAENSTTKSFTESATSPTISDSYCIDVAREYISCSKNGELLI